jgi:hypothetical protein
MAQTKFSVGQRVSVARGSTFGATAGGFCSVVTPLPRGAGPQQYRVRTEGENFDRIIDEARLEAVSYD